MIKLFLKFLVTSLTVIVLVLGMNTNVLATPMYIEYEGNILKASFDEVKDLLGDYCDIITEENWPPIVTETALDVDIDELTIDDSGALIVLKAANKSYLYCNPNPGSSITISAPDGHGISYYASVPDASIMLLLGSSLLGLAVYRRKSKRTE